MKYARSEIHLSELVDAVCEEFENYVQAREKTAERLHEAGRLWLFEVSSESC